MYNVPFSGTWAEWGAWSDDCGVPCGSPWTRKTRHKICREGENEIHLSYYIHSKHTTYYVHYYTWQDGEIVDEKRCDGDYQSYQSEKCGLEPCYQGRHLLALLAFGVNLLCNICSSKYCGVLVHSNHSVVTPISVAGVGPLVPVLRQLRRGHQGQAQAVPEGWVPDMLFNVVGNWWVISVAHLRSQKILICPNPQPSMALYISWNLAEDNKRWVPDSKCKGEGIEEEECNQEECTG